MLVGESNVSKMTFSNVMMMTNNEPLAATQCFSIRGQTLRQRKFRMSHRPAMVIRGDDATVVEEGEEPPNSSMPLHVTIMVENYVYIPTKKVNEIIQTDLPIIITKSWVRNGINHWWNELVSVQKLQMNEPFDEQQTNQKTITP